MNVIVHENADGTLAITTMAPNFVAAEIKKGKSEALIYQEHELRLASENPTATIRGSFSVDILPDGGGAHMEHVLDENLLTVSQQPYADQRRCFRNQWRWVDGVGVVEDPALVLAEKSKRAKAVRNRMLELTDKEEFRLTGTALANIRAWRQQLRDLGAQIDLDPDSVIWPAKP